MNTIKFEKHSNHIIRDDYTSDWISYYSFYKMVINWKIKFGCSKRKLIFIYAPNTVDSVAAFLACIRGGHTVAVLNPKLSLTEKIRLEKKFEPNIVIERKEQVSLGAILKLRKKEVKEKYISSSNNILLQTSGSTGEYKLVRLSWSNLFTNSLAISNKFRLTTNDIASAHLSMHYSFGLSVILSHFIAKSRIRLTEKSFLSKSFWNDVEKDNVSHFYGVPIQFNAMRAIESYWKNIATLRSLAQAGGRLDSSNQKYFHKFMSRKGGMFWVMYGQTETSPRITMLKHSDWEKNPNSVGQTLQDIKVIIIGENNKALPAREVGKVLIKGPNVMMGYAKTLGDLSKGDCQASEILTNDLGYLNEEGFLFITGRVDRVIKLAGLRINLDAVEYNANGTNSCAVFSDGKRIIIHLKGEKTNVSIEKSIVNKISESLSIPQSLFVIEWVQDILVNANGKPNYPSLLLNYIEKEK